MELQSEACALAERELIGGFALNQDDSKSKFFLGKAEALVARNLKGALLFLKGAIK